MNQPHHSLIIIYTKQYNIIKRRVECEHESRDAAAVPAAAAAAGRAAAADRQRRAAAAARHAHILGGRFTSPALLRAAHRAAVQMVLMVAERIEALRRRQRVRLQVRLDGRRQRQRIDGVHTGPADDRPAAQLLQRQHLV